MVWIIINTYQREQMLNRLLHQLKELSKGRVVYVKIYMDGCDYKNRPYDLNGDGFSINYKKVPHHGREFYHKLMEMGWRQSCIADYYIQLPDDITLEDNFFECLDMYKPGTVLDLMNDNRDKGILKRYERTSLVRGMDLCILYDRSIQELLRGLYMKVTVNKSSGVARYLNHYFRKAGIEIYLVNETLVRHSDHESKMNPERDNPIIA